MRGALEGDDDRRGVELVFPTRRGLVSKSDPEELDQIRNRLAASDPWHHRDRESAPFRRPVSGCNEACGKRGSFARARVQRKPRPDVPIELVEVSRGGRKPVEEVSGLQLVCFQQDRAAPECYRRRRSGSRERVRRGPQAGLDHLRRAGRFSDQDVPNANRRSFTSARSKCSAFQSFRIHDLTSRSSSWS